MVQTKEIKLLKKQVKRLTSQLSTSKTLMKELQPEKQWLSSDLKRVNAKLAKVAAYDT